MPKLEDYAKAGFTGVVFIREFTHLKRHHYDHDYSNETIAAINGQGEYVEVLLTWNCLPPDESHAQYHYVCVVLNTRLIDHEKYAQRLSEHGLLEDPPEENKVVCPSCGACMKRRKNRKTGSEFWGCLNYPFCKCTKQI